MKRISQMLPRDTTLPMDIVNHPDFARASWVAKANSVDTPLDSILRGTEEKTAEKLGKLGL